MSNILRQTAFSSLLPEVVDSVIFPVPCEKDGRNKASAVLSSDMAGLRSCY